MSTFAVTITGPHNDGDKAAAALVIISENERRQKHNDDPVNVDNQLPLFDVSSPTALLQSYQDHFAEIATEQHKKFKRQARDVQARDEKLIERWRLIDDATKDQILALLPHL